MRSIRSAALAATLALAGCGATFQTHGYAPDPGELSLLTVGLDTMDSVESQVGRPSTAGVLRGNAWYYVEERRRQFGPRAPRPISRELVALSFDEAGTLTNVERFGLERGRVVTLSRRVTRSTIREFGLIQQLLRNFGRIDVGQTLADEV